MSLAYTFALSPRDAPCNQRKQKNLKKNFMITNSSPQRRIGVAHIDLQTNQQFKYLHQKPMGQHPLTQTTYKRSIRLQQPQNSLSNPTLIINHLTPRIYDFESERALILTQIHNSPRSRLNKMVSPASRKDSLASYINIHQLQRNDTQPHLPQFSRTHIDRFTDHKVSRSINKTCKPTPQQQLQQIHQQQPTLPSPSKREIVELYDKIERWDFSKTINEISIID